MANTRACVAFVMLWLFAGSAEGDSPPPFTVPGMFTVETPDGGYQWSMAPAEKLPPGISIYICMREEGGANIFLLVDRRTETRNQPRAKVVEGHYRGAMNRLTAGNFQNVKITEPKLEAPIPDRVTFHITATSPAGAELHYQATTVFGKNTALIAVGGSTADELDQLAKVADTYEETVGEEADTFEVPGSFSIATPKGYRWSEHRQMEMAGMKAVVYTCLKDQAAANAVLVVEQRQAVVEPARVATLKGAFNGLVDELKSQGLRDFKGHRPNLTPPIPDQVAWLIAATSADGVEAYFHTTIVFGKRIYSLRCMGRSRKEVEELAKLAKTLKEQTESGDKPSSSEKPR